MVVLGVDPGGVNTGWLVLADTKVLAFGTERSGYMQDVVDSIAGQVSEFPIDLIVVEDASQEWFTKRAIVLLNRLAKRLGARFMALKPRPRPERLRRREEFREAFDRRLYDSWNRHVHDAFSVAEDALQSIRVHQTQIQLVLTG